MINLFGDSYDEPTKKCSKCKQDLQLHMFGRASGGNYLRGECKKCGREISKSKEKAKSSAYSVPKNHICPICLRAEEAVKNRGGKRSGAWCCDHDHISEKFRGWLCHDCNRGIGVLGEDVDRLKRAIEYLSNAKKLQESANLTEFLILDPVSD
jgi:hypothetical protein